MRNENFSEQLQFGNDGELLIMDLLIGDGFHVIPTFDYKTAFNKAPLLHSLDHSISPPDLDCAKDGSRFWVEVKRYPLSPWNRTVGCNVHGLQKRKYEDYKAVESVTGTPVFLAVLEGKREEKDESRETTGVVLYARLAELEPLPCMCSGCQHKWGSCRAPISANVYFNRSQFTVRWKIGHLINVGAAS